MSNSWAERQRRTNKLVRLAANYVFDQNVIKPEQLYGLCKLTWVTRNCKVQNASYIKSTKIPALSKIFQIDYSAWRIEDVANNIYNILGGSSKELVRGDTGFTNFYNSYRNSAEDWIKKNRKSLLPLFELAEELETDSDRHRLIKEIEKLPWIPKPTAKKGKMRPHHLLTPVFFALDKSIRFPIINGKENVKKLLSVLKATNASLEVQYTRMVRLISKHNGIRDAADLDQVGKRKMKAILELIGTLEKPGSSC